MNSASLMSSTCSGQSATCGCAVLACPPFCFVASEEVLLLSRNIQFRMFEQTSKTEHADIGGCCRAISPVVARAGKARATFPCLSKIQLPKTRASQFWGSEAGGALMGMSRTSDLFRELSGEDCHVV